jgi:peptidoglycan endopeptidase LytE
MRQQVLTQRRRRAKGVPKKSTVAIYASIFALIIAIVAVGYHSPQQSTADASAATTVNAYGQTVSQTSVDDVVAANIAADVAQTTNLSVASNVEDLAVSTQIQSEVPQSTDSSDNAISKPQIIQPSSDNRAISSYTVQSGDTVTSVAAHFGLQTNTIAWANNLTSDTLIAGTTLQILPTDGIIYTVQSGDTVASIATKYQADPSQITLYNDLDLGGLTPGVKIIIPGGVLPVDERPGYVAPRVVTQSYVGESNAQYVGISNAQEGNRYSFGYCTWYAYNLRAQMGMPIGSFWGNASSWAYAAEASGYVVDHTPSYGAIMQNGGGAGHVAVVTAVAPNGDVTVSEMNDSGVAGGGWDRIDTRTISAGQAESPFYFYIH